MCKALWKCQIPEPSWVAVPSFILIHPSADREPTTCAFLPGVAIVGWMKILKSICLIAAFQDFMRSDFSLSHLCTFYSLITVLHS